ncbi:MAG: hypothetical protein ACRD19_06005 [Terriglobia bacterium]
MSVASVSQTIASQHEFLRPELELLYMASSRLWSRIKARTDIQPVSNRPSRIPFEALSGGKFRAWNPDGGDMGQGSGPTEVYGTLSCVYFLQASQYTSLAESSTDSDEKAIKNYVSLTQQRAAETIAAYMDAVVQGDGSNTLDTVVSTTTNGIVCNNANAFQDNQDVDVWSALGGTFRGTVTVESVDIANNTIWLTTAYPTGTVAGDLLLVSGSAGIANSGLFGLRYYQVSGNAGSYMNIQRSAFPGKYSTPYINVNGALTPAIVRALEGQIELAMSIDRADQADLVAHCNVDMRAAWENNAILVQRVIMNEVKGDESVDMLKKNAPTQIAGRELLVNERAKPGIIDFLGLKHWFRIEGQALDYYEVGGQTIFPAYGASGGLAASMIFYLVTGVQTGNGQPRIGAYMDNISIPHGFFGH